ncbi:hypothetical protein SAMN06297129_3643 [Pseudooceanicola antarcticus]|uniref:Uncharacterized protein n=1 Tax=Pseudooceanicola antarcticus TaxID=1247613 RepID=A0A285JHR0_9RHOB|nr:hypothetical protein [Pseudooceanicola antarcticus]PJE31027.1 hypothetical protein CVM39_04335 [Pseudooceanicola antarcticus]SNY58916.1 hypothetical protein SAMN06297129_3643 [Pseudooceanicola antarcticus]
MAARPATARLNRIALWLVLAPLMCWLLAMALTIALGGLGCTIDEGSTHACRLLGLKLDNFAYSVGLFAAWGGLIVLPLSAGFALLWGGVRLMLALALPKDTSRNAPPKDR